MVHVLPRPYYKHWLTLAAAVHILLQDRTTQVQLLLVKICSDIPQLYGKEHCSYNVHTLLHMVESCRDCGLPWTTSAFIFEDINGKLLNLFFGTRSVPNQMCKYFKCYKALISKDDYIFQNAPIDIVDIYRSLTNKCYLSKTGKQINDVVVIGTGYENDISPEEDVALTNIGVIVNSMSCLRYNRCINSHSLCSTTEYDSSFKRSNSVIATAAGHGIITSFVVLPKVCECDCRCDCKEVIVLCKRLDPIPQQNLLYDTDINVNINHFMTKVIDTNIIFACRTIDVISKCILISHNNTLTVIKIPVFEHD